MSAISALSWHRSGRGPPTSFNPPRLSRPFTFTRPQLIGSFARAAALSHSSPAVLQGLTQAFDELLKTLVDPGPTELTFRTDVESLSDNLRVAFSGFLGAAIADLLMMQLGYAFRCNGRELLKQGRIFDLAYDSGSLVAGDIVAVEAKGRLRSTATPALVRQATVQGYDKQVKGFLGKTLRGGRVVHGYGIGTGSQLKQGAASHAHVEESGPHRFQGAPAPPSPGTTPRAANGMVVLGNFRAITRLMGGGGILEAIDAGLRGDWGVTSRIGSQTLAIAQWQNKEYLIIPPIPDYPRSIQDFQSLFGLRLDAAFQFLGGLTRCIQQRNLPERFPVELLVRPSETAIGTLVSSPGAEFTDGLTYFGATAPVASGTLLWSADRGLIP